MFAFKNTYLDLAKLNNKSFAPIWVSAPLSLALLACGGGGGGKSAPPEPQAETSQNGDVEIAPPPAGWQTDSGAWAAHEEFQAQSGLDRIKAQEAYAKGITGEGVTIGFVDTGLDVTHAEFADKTIKLNDRSGVQTANNTQLRHGTGVASVALGARGQGSSMHGVAFDADPAMWSLNLSRSGYLTVNDTILTNAARALQGSGARIINQSWGYETLLDPSLSDTQRDFLSGSYGDFLAEMRRGKAIHVWAAGNAGGDQISVSTAWPILFPELAGYSIAVAALGQDGRIGRRSNHCGVAADHCLVAPGGVATGTSAYTRMARAGGGYRTAYGTSYAAPYVSGVLALMQQAFGDQLSLPEYTARLFATADKTGIYANREIYGQGVVDADAALSPQGDSYIPLPSGGLIAPHQTRIGGGDLPRDMLERLRNERIIILDELNAPFSTQLAVQPDPYQSFELTEWMTYGDNKTTPYSHPVLASFASLFDGPSLGEYWQLVPIAKRNNSINGNHLPAGGLGFVARRTRRRSRLELGVIGEENSLFGTGGEGALKLGHSHSVLLGYGRDVTWGETKLSLDTQLSFSHAEGDMAALMRGASRAVASSFQLGVSHGALAMTLKQPIYFEQGDLHVNVPVKRQAGGKVVFEVRDFALRSPHRPWELELLYGDGDARVGLKMEKHAGHPVQTLFGYMRRF